MSTYTETISNKLNDLLEKTYDAEKGFKKAAENTNHTYLKRYFERKSKERHNFGYELNNEIRSFGERAEKSGSITGVAHRTWMDIKALFTMDSDESMLEEAIRGEKAALEEYKDVLNETSLPMSTHTILLKQQDSIESDLRTIKRLEDLH
ncbi:PA2169 family four-helix-bundle protein [Mariniflexile litorale]|uniref:PA2169 family four-helix-bundle protein n=1 Tax=Mariniflexile litorale TaxID=3045158 RepID=A0AAU7EGM4_9FLAO|nr:PA2169 family four-helix-bundle protein [Mariniflexile sp. KMM 9835]MDQ8211900.1 PA2169 family four-helix-bundle protein [Mariniflexile sp. KMM 9835]